MRVRSVRGEREWPEGKRLGDPGVRPAQSPALRVYAQAMRRDASENERLRALVDDAATNAGTGGGSGDESPAGVSLALHAFGACVDDPLSNRLPSARSL